MSTEQMKRFDDIWEDLRPRQQVGVARLYRLKLHLPKFMQDITLCGRPLRGSFVTNHGVEVATCRTCKRMYDDGHE